MRTVISYKIYLSPGDNFLIDHTKPEHKGCRETLESMTRKELLQLQTLYRKELATIKTSDGRDIYNITILLGRIKQVLSGTWVLTPPKKEN